MRYPNDIDYPKRVISEKEKFIDKLGLIIRDINELNNIELAKIADHIEGELRNRGMAII